MKTFLLVALLLLSSCAHSLGYAGSHPGEVSCKGKASVSGMGAAGAGAGIVGTEGNAFAINFDCGDGAYLRQDNPQAPVSAPVTQ